MEKKNLLGVVVVILGVAILVSLSLGKTDHKGKNSSNNEDTAIVFTEKTFQSGIECLQSGEIEKVTSVEQLNNFVQTCAFENNFLLEQDYDEDYFKESFLLIMAQTVNSGGYSFETEHVLNNGEIVISQQDPSADEMVSMEVVTHYMVLELDKGVENTEFTVQYED